jgi:hypothetical protein
VGFSHPGLALGSGVSVLAIVDIDAKTSAAITGGAWLFDAGYY